MTEKFIAIAVKGQEFVFKKSSMIAVPTQSAKKIADTLNELKYQLKSDNETWFVYDNDWYYDSCIAAEIKRYSARRMPVYAYHG